MLGNFLKTHPTSKPGLPHNRRLRQYIPTLDGWRAVAIAMVLFCHVRLPGNVLADVSPYGALGVDLFFAISGFLITSRLIDENRIEGGISLKAFYVRRFFRIIPPAFAYLACAAVLGLVLGWIPMNLGQLAASACFYRNYYSMGVDHSWYTGHFWSLAVEEHFYLLWPALLVWFGVKRGRLLAPALACGVAIWRALDSHFAWVAMIALPLKDSVARTDYRLDGLLWGCALAFVLQSGRGRAWIEKLCTPLVADCLRPGNCRVGLGSSTGACGPVSDPVSAVLVLHGDPPRSAHCQMARSPPGRLDRTLVLQPLSLAAIVPARARSARAIRRAANFSRESGARHRRGGRQLPFGGAADDCRRALIAG